MVNPEEGLAVIAVLPTVKAAGVGVEMKFCVLLSITMEATFVARERTVPE